MELKNILIDNSPAAYIPSDELIHAAEVAYALKRPLLLSGSLEPEKRNLRNG
jgi:hypothetical protein